jgi:TPR repeat protein
MASKNLGIMYYTGAGVARDIPKGEQYLKKAARQNWEFADALPKLMKKLDATKRRRKSK